MSKISQLTPASSLTGVESLPIVQSGNSRKVPVSNILTDNLFTPSGAGAVAESVQTSLRRIIYAAQYGVVGNGVTDDTANFNLARTAALGKILYITGTPLISSALSITTSEHWVFDGVIGNSLAGTPTSFLVKKSTLNADLVTITGGAAYGTIIENGGIQGQVGNGGNGYVIKANGVQLKNPWVALMGQDGIRVGSDSAGTNANSFKILAPVVVSNVRHGVFVDDQSINANAGEINQCTAQSNGGDGVKLDRAQKNLIIAPLCETNTGIGLHFAANANWNVSDGGDCAEVNVGGDIVFDIGSAGNIVNGTSYATLTDNGAGNWVSGGPSSKMGFGAQFQGGSDPGGSLKSKSSAAGTQALALWNAAVGGVRYIIYVGTEAAFTARGALVVDANGRVGLTESGGTKGLFVDPTTGAIATNANRLNRSQGAVVASANNLSLGADGNYFQISGATQINLLDNTNWQGGSEVTLKFNSTPTVKHNQTTSGANVKIILNAAVDFVAAASNTLTLRYDSTDVAWYEQSRKV